MPIEPFALKYDPKALDCLEKLPKDLQKRIADKLSDCKPNPFRFLVRLQGRTDYKLKVGDYRVIADINLGERIIEITKIGHRKNIYK